MAPYLEMEDFTVEGAKRVCGDVAGLAAWSRAMAVFYGINKEVLPLKVELFNKTKKKKSMITLVTVIQFMKIIQSRSGFKFKVILE